MTEVKKIEEVKETPQDLYIEEQEVNVEEQLYNNSYCNHFLEEALKKIKVKNK